MKIALVSDIHGNQHAFKAILNHIKREHHDRIVLLGDYIFGGCGSNDVIDMLMVLKKSFVEVHIIKGNIDELIGPIEAKAEWVYPINYALYHELGEERINFVKCLPKEVVLELGKRSLRFIHNPSEHFIYHMIDQVKRERNTVNHTELKVVADNYEEDILVFGHYHLFLDERINEKTLISPSSVGLPFNGKPQAQYMTLILDEDHVMTVEHYIEYNTERIREDMEVSGYLNQFPEDALKYIKTVETGHNHM